MRTGKSTAPPPPRSVAHRAAAEVLKVGLQAQVLVLGRRERLLELPRARRARLGRRGRVAQRGRLGLEVGERRLERGAVGGVGRERGARALERRRRGRVGGAVSLVVRGGGRGVLGGGRSALLEV